MITDAENGEMSGSAGFDADVRVRCEQGLKDDLRDIARARRLKPSDIARIALWEYVEKEKAKLQPA
jgi:hypothetical protein